MKTIPITQIPITELVPAPWNYKLDDDADKAEKFRRSLETNGLLYGLVVAQRQEEPANPIYEVCDGNHRLAVLQQAGLVEVPVYNLGRRSRAQRQRIAIELNEWRFTTDTFKLAKCFEDMTLEISLDDLEITMPYTAEQIGSMLNLALDSRNEAGEVPDIRDDLENLDKQLRVDTVPEVTLTFATHDEFTRFMELTGYQKGQRLMWSTLQAVLAPASIPVDIGDDAALF